MNTLLVFAGLLSLWVTASCQDSKLQTSAPSSADANKKDERKPPASEMVDRPVPVHGAWLTAEVLEESQTNGKATATLGISSYFRGIKATDDRDRFMIMFTASPNANTGATVTPEEIANGNYDHRVRVEGTSLAQVRRAYGSIILNLTIYDRNDGTMEYWSSSIEDALSPTTMKKTSSSQSTSTSASTGNVGSPGTTGLAGAPTSP